MTDQQRFVFGGVDTHKAVHVAAVIDDVGRLLATEPFPATGGGYRGLVAWMGSFGEIVRVGVEGTGAYGAGLARHLATADVDVVEVNRPNRQTRRQRGKSDTIDAEAAARAALNREATGLPKDTDGIVESIRVIRVAFCSSRSTRTRVSNQIQNLINTAPTELRAQLETLTNGACVERCARFRPGDLADPTEGTKAALRALARRYQALTSDLDELRDHLDTLTLQANPALRNAYGVGADVASILLVVAGDNPERLTSDAAFAALCAASPVEASSGKIVRHRLNRGGNRQGNHALWRIAMIRLQRDPDTKAYAARRRAQGKTNRDIIRCLKRYIAREIYQHLVNPQPVADISDLRITRNGARISLEVVAGHFGVWPAVISRIERGLTRNDELVDRYRTWLTQNAA